MRRTTGVCIWLYAALCAGTAAQAAIPAAERQALLNLYSSTGGSGWIQNGGWNNGNGGTGTAGSECGSSSAPPWYGVTCNGSSTHVIGINLEQNGLVGTLPDLSALTYLQTFIVSYNNYCSSSSDTNCGLGGTIPSLSALTSLQGFSIEGDEFTGSIPTLSALSQLRGFDVAGNELTGSIPSLSGLANLQGFNASNNDLSGNLPTLSGLTSLAVFDVHGNELTGSIPALSGLTSLQAFYVFSNELSGSIPALGGLTALQFFNASDNELSGSIPSLSGLTSLATFDVDSNELTGAMPALTGLTALTGIDVGGNKLTGNVPVVPNPDGLQAGGSVLCGNAFTATPDANWDAATGTSPWYLACGLSASTVDLDQHGLTGTWWNPDTSGQGFVFNVYADNVATGHGTFFAGWYTFDVSGGSGAQRWYTLQGDVYSATTSASLGIYTATDGYLAASPSPGSSQVGTATLSFSDCSTGTLVYAFDDGRAGSIPLTRLTANTTCGSSGDNGSAAANYLLSGAWYDPNHSGQGLFIDISPGITTLFGSWYTFFPSSYTASSPRQQWFVFQDSSFASTATSATGIKLGQARGGSFDAAGGVTRDDDVGTVSLSFKSCTAAMLTYSIAPNTLYSESASGTISLVRLGPAPAGCSL
ncbi:MAG: hypothetical protein QM741_03630 [Rudaea sp.]|uniref:leucine-rich repeat domain-containing protein n=1 Tax=Rudaea sp. TaxID=2136325 RepID=UPI0039E24789